MRIQEFFSLSVLDDGYFSTLFVNFSANNESWWENSGLLEAGVYEGVKFGADPDKNADLWRVILFLISETLCW